MTQKIILQLEVDDSQLDQAQAKLDKFIATLELIHDKLIHLETSHEINLGKLMSDEIFKEVKQCTSTD